MASLSKLAVTSFAIFGSLAVWMYITMDMANRLFLATVCDAAPRDVLVLDTCPGPDVFGLAFLLLWALVGGLVLSIVYARIWEDVFPPEDDDITGEKL